MKKQFFILVIILPFILISCSDSNKNNPSGPDNSPQLSPNPEPIAGTYQYSGYDAEGNLLSYGTITIAVKDTIISGSRDLNGNGFENGKGEISGIMDNNEITITLTPNSIAHFMLKGEFSKGSFSGDRLLDTGTTIMVRNEGTFKAEKTSY